MKKRVRSALVGGGALALTSVGVFGACTDGLTVSETDVVLTIRDKGRDYEPYKTYSLSNEVVDLCGVVDGEVDPLGPGGAGGRTGIDLEGCVPVDHDYDDTILASIERNMDALGYTKVEVDESPDLTVLVGIVARTHWYYQPSYVWCDPYYYDYCWYPRPGYIYSLTTGAVIINMIDVAESQEDSLQSVWFAALQGLYAASELSIDARIERGVDKAFEQSPYLAEGGDQ